MTLSAALEIAGSALTAHSRRLQVHAANLANLDTPNYTRKIPILSEQGAPDFNSVLSTLHSGGALAVGGMSMQGGVSMVGTVADPTPHKRIYQPEHPDADADGFVTFSNTNVLWDMADATLTSRAYEANISVISIVKAMEQRALEIGR